MRLAEVLFFYVCVGLGVAARVGTGRRLVVLLLWPLFLPSLLTPAEARFETVAPAGPSGPIAAALHRLQEALARWEHAPALPLGATERALVDLDRRRQALAELLRRPENQLDAEAPGEPAAVAQRRQSLTALVALHQQLGEEIEGALARMDALATRIQLAHFSGQALVDPSRQIAELVRTIEGIRAAHEELEGRTGRDPRRAQA